MRKFWIAAIAVLCLVPGKQAFASYTTSAAHSVNNAVTSIDYKMSEDTQKEINKLFTYGYLSVIDKDESEKYVVKSAGRDLDSIQQYQQYADEDSNKSLVSDTATAKSYLINHNLLERKSAFRYDTKTGLFYAVQYETLENEWNKVFEIKRKTFNEKLGEAGSATECLKVYSDFADYVEEASLLDTMVDAGMVTSTERTEIVKSIRDLVKQEKDRSSDDRKALWPDGYERYTLSGWVKYYDDAMDEVEDVFDDYFTNPKVADDDKVRKSDALMNLYKAACGTIDSRPIVWNKTAVRNAATYSQSTSQYWNNGKLITDLANCIKGTKTVEKYWDNYGGEAADFKSGDYYYYVSSNVYELYLKALLDKGIIFRDEFSTDEEEEFGATLNKEIKKFDSVTPAWWNENGLCSASVDGGLGASWSYNSGGKIRAKKPRYFADESLSRGEFLQYAEDILRISEDDMTETEADIITYKYGISYLSAYSASMKKTLSFLIAKGILNFESDEDYQDLNSRITYAEMYRILYKVANKDARSDFSTITLTDAESFWQKQGFGANAISSFNLSNTFVMDDGSVEEESVITDLASAETSAEPVALRLRGLFSKRLEKSTKNVALAAGTSNYRIVYKLAKGVKWSYAGTLLKDIASGNKTSKDVESVTTGNMKYNGKSVAIYKLTCVVKASSESGALKKVEKNISCPVGSGDKTINAVTKVKQAGSSSPTYTLISQSSLKENFSDISIIEDKVLLNTKTGSQAIILPDLGYALVGNTVIRTSTFLMEKAGDEVYYNLEVILSLLDDAYLKKVGVHNALYRNTKYLKDYYVTTKSEYADAFGKATLANIKLTTKMAKNAGSLDRKNEVVQMYRVNSITSGLNTLVRTFRVKTGGTTKEFTMVVDWKFAIPSVDEFAKGGSCYEVLEDSNASEKDVRSVLYTRPTKGTVLQNWWDSNFVANNMLANYIYGTEGVCYIASGYLTPSVTILAPVTVKSNADKWVQNLFTDSKGAFAGRVWNDYTTTDEDLIGSYFGSQADWAAWYQTFYDPTEAFAGVANATDKEATVLSGLVSGYRKFQICFSQKTSTYGGQSYEAKYLRTNAGTLYRSIADDTRLTYTAKSNKNVKSIKVQTRTNVAGNLKKGVTTIKYTANGTEHTMLYNGIVSSTDSSGSKQKYYKLSPIDNLAVKDTSSDLYNGGKLLYSDNYSNYSTYPKFVPYKGVAIENPQNAYTDLWKIWSTEYTGEASPPLGFNYANAFYYSEAVGTAAMKNVTGSRYDVMYRYNGTAKKKLKNAGTFAKLVESLGKFGIAVKANYPYSNTVWSQTADGFGTHTVVNRLATEKSLLEGTAGSVITDGSTKADSNVVMYALPAFYLSTKEWTIYSEDTVGKTSTECKMVKDNKSAAICFGNYFYSGIAKTVQESIISKYVQTTDLQNLQAGAMVTIGDVRFYVDKLQDSDSSVWLTSVGITGRGARAALRDSAAAWKSTSKSQKAFKSQALKMFKDLVIMCDGKGYPFTNYVVGKGKSGVKSGVQPGALRKTKNTKKYGVIYLDGTKIYGYKKGKSGLKVGRTDTGKYLYTTIRFRLDGKLKVRPLNDEHTIFTLTNTTASGNIGVGDDDLIFYQEDLSYDDDQYSDISVSSTRYVPSAAYKAIKTKFMQMHTKAFAGDLKTLVLMIITYIAAYLAVMSWIAYLALRVGGMRIFFEALAAGPGKRPGHGFDLIKITTFGIYSLDDDPPLSRAVLTILVCMIVMLTALNLV